MKTSDRCSHARESDEETIPALRALASHPRVVAIGECGLNFNRNYSPHFAALLRSRRDRLPRAVAHCFTGERAELHAYLDLDLHIGFSDYLIRRIPLGKKGRGTVVFGGKVRTIAAAGGTLPY